jgi:very-short-patch-repair endonuclease
MMEINKYSSNKKELKLFRKNLRNRSTSAEASLWNLLKNKQLDGRKFRRQHSLENYIVDFYCSSEKLIIELDGDPHGDYSRIQKDTVRDNYFNTLGYKVIRFENRFVFQDPELVLETIRGSFINCTNHLPPFGVLLL